MENGFKKSQSESPISPYGANELKVKGFKSKQHLNNHWRKHANGYGGISKEQYQTKAVELAESGMDEDILGYLTKEGYICRYNRKTNDYVKADVDKGIRTMFRPDEGEAYFWKRKELEDENET